MPHRVRLRSLVRVWALIATLGAVPCRGQDIFIRGAPGQPGHWYPGGYTSKQLNGEEPIPAPSPTPYAMPEPSPEPPVVRTQPSPAAPAPLPPLNIVGMPGVLTKRLIAATDSGDPGERASAARALARVTAERSRSIVLHLLTNLLYDEDSRVVREATRSLGALGDPRASTELIKLMNHAADDATIGTAVDALGKAGDARALEELSRLRRFASGRLIDRIKDAMAVLETRLTATQGKADAGATSGQR